jgi:hypothetical protein
VILEIDNDGLPDFLVSTNDSKMRVAASRSTQKNRTASTVQLRFVDAGSTSRIAGARVTVRYEKYPQQTFELAAGSGYLSQQSPVLFFSRPQDLNGQIEIVWSDGKQTKHEVNSIISSSCFSH